MSGDPIRVLVVDDSVVIRRLLSNIIDADPDLEVCGIAQNGLIALDKVELLKPDVVTLDVEMPELDGIGTLKRMRPAHPKLPIVMFSTLTEKGASATMTALSLGATDYVTKPANVGGVAVAMERVREQLVPKLKALGRKTAPASFTPLARPVRSAPPSGAIEVVAIGSSTGGPNALSDVIGALPADMQVPVVVVQHMPALFTKFLADRLDSTCAISVVEAEAGMTLRPGTVYIAPGGEHMVLHRKAIGPTVALNEDDPVNFCRPAVDVLFRSVADMYGGKTLAVMLTGMGQDGRDGCVALKELGAHVIAQDEATSVVWGMPGAVVTAGLADDVLPLETIGSTINKYVSTRAVRGLISATRK